MSTKSKPVFRERALVISIISRLWSGLSTEDLQLEMLPPKDSPTPVQSFKVFPENFPEPPQSDKMSVQCVPMRIDTVPTTSDSFQMKIYSVPMTIYIVQMKIDSGQMKTDIIPMKIDGLLLRSDPDHLSVDMSPERFDIHPMIFNGTLQILNSGRKSIRNPCRNRTNPCSGPYHQGTLMDFSVQGSTL